MANIKTIFCSSELSEQATEIQTFHNMNNEIYIGISNQNTLDIMSVGLDIETAIRFVKELKKEIAILKQIQDGGK